MTRQEQRENSRAVSPVIGVILMVAITVILAAVIANMVLGVGDTGEPGPTASFSSEFHPDAAPSEVKITHTGGDSITAKNLYLVLDGTRGPWYAASPVQPESEVNAGVSATIPADADDTVRVVWEPPEGDTSKELHEWTGPDA